MEGRRTLEIRTGFDGDVTQSLFVWPFDVCIQRSRNKTHNEKQFKISFDSCDLKGFKGSGCVVDAAAKTSHFGAE